MGPPLLSPYMVNFMQILLITWKKKTVIILNFDSNHSSLFINRWPYPFLDLSSHYAPLW